MNIHLVDGTFELFRHFFSKYTRPHQRPDGLDVSAARGVVRSMLGMLREDDVTHVAVAFDQVIESFRNRLFDGYKTGDGIDPVLAAQFPVVEEACRRAGLVVWPMVDFEADDGLAAGAAKWRDHPDVERIVLCSPDKDLSQCVGGKVVMFDRMRKNLFDTAAVEAKFGVPPQAIPDYLALVGDPQDGIPGVPRWGAKGTATLLAHYGCVEKIPNDPDQWAVKTRGAKGLADNLCRMREEVKLYKLLATLREDAPVPGDLDDLHWTGVADAKWLATEMDL
jgi:5'-3' exonuclease